MGVESQGAMPPRPEDEIIMEGQVIEFPTGEPVKPRIKPHEQQIREEIHSRFEKGDLSVPEFVTDSKGTESQFTVDPKVEFQVAKDRKMEESVKDGWEDVKPREFKL